MSRFRIKFDPSIVKAAPDVRLYIIEATVENSPTSDSLWELVSQCAEQFRSVMELSEVSSRPGIAATRAAYKACGKDPNRYRPSSDALTRRVIKGMDLYRLETLIDIINLASLRSGYSIGCFDADKICGDTLTLGIGREGEPYEGIGRGSLNISGMPVLRDKCGGIATPTSDNERTKVTLNTRKILVVINNYGDDEEPSHTVESIVSLLQEFASGKDFTCNSFAP